jgi:hypothetical protein
MELLVRYRTLDRRSPLTGQGRLINMSSGGVLVATQQEISAGKGVELCIQWPFLLDGRVPLQLVAAGKVVRSDTSCFALLLKGHQFRTTRSAGLNGWGISQTRKSDPADLRGRPTGGESHS